MFLDFKPDRINTSTRNPCNSIRNPVEYFDKNAADSAADTVDTDPLDTDPVDTKSSVLSVEARALALVLDVSM